MFTVSDGYAWKKASEAASCLVGGSNLTQALEYAAQALIGFPVEDVPDEIKEQYLSLWKSFTCMPASGDEGSIAATLRITPASRQRRLAELVLNLYGSVCKLCGAHEASGLDLTNSDRKFKLNQAEEYAFLDWFEFDTRSEGATDNYRKLVATHLPNFPAEVVDQWLLRHAHQVRQEWAHLSWPNWRFEKVSWSFDRLKEIRTRDPGWTEIGPDTQGGSHLMALRDNWLVEFMKTNHTWPVAPIVLEHAGLADHMSRPLPAPVVLVDGHRRLSYLLNLGGESQTRNHDVWRATLVDRSEGR